MTDTTTDLRYYISILKKRQRTILNTSLVMAIIALLVSFIISPTYEAETNLRIKAPRGLANSLLADQQGDSSYTSQAVSTYAQMLISHTVVQAVIDKTQADKDVPLEYEDMLKNIKIKPVKDTEIINVKVWAPSPEEAELAANTLTEKLISMVTADQSAVREFLGNRLKESKQDLEQAEQALEKYKREHQMIDPDVQSKAMVDKLSAIDKLVAENQVNLAAAQAKLSNTQQQLAGEKPGFIADNPLIQQYNTKLVDLEVQLVDAQSKYTENHPKVAALRTAITDTRAKLNSEVARVINADATSSNPVHQNLLQEKIMAEADAAAAAAQKAAINNVLGDNEKEMAALPAKAQGVTRLMREVQVAQDIYTMLHMRYEEARINEVMQPVDVKVVDPAVVANKPVRPKKALNAILAAVLGMFFSTGRAFFLEYRNRTIRDEQEAKQALGLPVLGIIPDFAMAAVPVKREPFWKRMRNMRFRK